MEETTRRRSTDARSSLGLKRESVRSNLKKPSIGRTLPEKRESDIDESRIRRKDEQQEQDLARVEGEVEEEEEEEEDDDDEEEEEEGEREAQREVDDFVQSYSENDTSMKKPKNDENNINTKGKNINKNNHGLFMKARRNSTLRNRMSLRMRKFKLQERKQKALLPMDETYLTIKANDELIIPPSIDEIPTYTKQISSNDEMEARNGVIKLRKLLQKEKGMPLNEIIKRVVDSGVLVHLVELLKRDTSPKLQLEAGWALTNVASGSSNFTRAVVEAGAIPPLVNLLNSKDPAVVDQSIWCIGNIAGDSAALRDRVLRAGGLQIIVDRVMKPQTQSEKGLENATWAMLNLLRSKPCPEFNLIRCCFTRLAQLLHSSNLCILKDACWAAAALSENTSYGCPNGVIHSGILERSVELMSHRNYKILTAALRTVGNVCTGSDTETQAVINFGGLCVLGKLALHSSKMVRKEASWTVSNLCAGNSDQVQAVFDAGLFPILIATIQHDDVEVAREALWSVANSTAGGSRTHIHLLVKELNAIAVMCEFMGKHLDDDIVCAVTLEGLENIFKAGTDSEHVDGNKFAVEIKASNCVEVIDGLQDEDSLGVATVAERIIEYLIETSDLVPLEMRD